MLVFDATPLIYLAKTDRLAKLEEIEDKKLIPASVYSEVVEAGKKKGEPDAIKIEKLVEEDVFVVQEVEADELCRKLKKSRLSQADRKVLALARQENGIAIVDEEYARTIADVENISNRGTIYLLFRLLQEGIIRKEEAKETLDAIIEAGWYCSTDLYSQIVTELDQFDD